MKIALVIETFDRRLVDRRNYLDTTLRNLAEVGVFESPLFHSLQIVSGGEKDDFAAAVESCIPPGVHVEWHPAPEQCTRQQNGMRAFDAGARTDADWVLKLEDDLDFVDDLLGCVGRFLAQMQQHSSPNHEVFSPMFCFGASFEIVSQSHYQEAGETVLGRGISFPHVRQALEKRRTWLAHPVGGFWGAQAILLRQRFARHLADWLGPDPALWDGKEWHRARGHDLMLQRWGAHLHAKAFITAIPAFVQHIGHESTLGNPRLEFPWPGRGWTNA